jgi:hypothetical protein
MTKKHPNKNTSYITIGSGHPIDSDVVIINGLEYKRVEEPKPESLYEVLINLGYHHSCDEILDAVKEWLPDEIALDGLPGDAEYSSGWNDCLKVIGNRLR